jgi:high-affinity nickel permease
MRKDRLKMALVGFLAGLGIGSAIGVLLMLLVNLFEKPVLHITWGNVLTFGVVLGLAMAIYMVHPPFGD